MSTHTGAAVGHMSPFAVLTREQRVKNTLARKPPGPDISWQEHAACRAVDEPEIFFAPPGPSGVRATEEAKSWCLYRCPVRAACLRFAFETGAEGVYGGTTLEERRAMRKRANRAGTPVLESLS